MMWKEGNVLFDNTLNTFYLWLYGIGHMEKDHSDSERENMLLPIHGLLFSLAARSLLYAPFHIQDSTYHDLCYTSHEALAGMKNSSMGPPRWINMTTHQTMSKCSTTELHLTSSYDVEWLTTRVNLIQNTISKLHFIHRWIQSKKSL